VLAGASGCLTKPLAPDDVALAIAQVTRGGTAFCQRAQDVLIGELRGQREINGPAHLTPREERLMCCLCKQDSDKEIAAKFGVAQSTIHSHLANLFRKLDVHSRDAAVRTYLRLS
jgi:two-component system nitrate/nitrite response regulator NarL